MKLFRKFITAVCGAVLLTGAICATANASRISSSQKSADAKTAASSITPDKGKFRIVLSGQAVGSEEFEISPSGNAWIARGSTNAHVPGAADIKANGQLTISSDGIPLHYEWSAQLQKKATGLVEFTNGTAKCSIDLGSGAPILKQFTFTSPRVAVLDNNLYYQYALLAQVYDWNAGGKQTFPVLIPQDMTPGSITVETNGPQPLDNGTSYESLRVNSTDLEILIYVDAKHHMVRLDVPSSKVTIEREK